MKCEHDDCLTCPYPDCISQKGPINSPKKKPGRKKMDPEERRKNKRRYQQDYNREHREEIRLERQKYYQDNAEKIRAQQQEYRNKMRGTPGRDLMNIWMTDGKVNKRVHANEYDVYKKKGWIRGRTMKPYRLNPHNCANCGKIIYGDAVYCDECNNIEPDKWRG